MTNIAVLLSFGVHILQNFKDLLERALAKRLGFDLFGLRKISKEIQSDVDRVRPKNNKDK
jgi:hypothetical protein